MGHKPVCFLTEYIWTCNELWRPSWPWSYDSWNYNYLCNQCLSPLMLWVRISIMARCTTFCDNVCQWLTISRWFSPGTLVSFTNKTDRHDITEILLKVTLSTIKQTTVNFLFLKVLLIWFIDNWYTDRLRSSDYCLSTQITLITL